MSEEPWHLNKSVPLTLVFTIAVQTIALVWFISQLNSTVDSNTRDIIRVQAEISVMERTVQTQAVSMARIDENIKAIRDAVDKMTGRDY